MKTVLRALLCLGVLNACGGNDSPTIPPNETIANLSAFNLVFPDNNLICTEGTEVGSDAVSINFIWSTSVNATSYNLEIKNLTTNETVTSTSNTTSKSIVVAKDTQFSWKVMASLNDKTRESEQWNFYSEGITEENFAPFPATITLEDNKDSTVNLSWVAEDLDNDLSVYDIYIGTEDNPSLFLENTTETTSINYSITYGQIYAIKVVSKDSRNNTFISQTKFRFE
jgi:hypothetical protein